MRRARPRSASASGRRSPSRSTEEELVLFVVDSQVHVWLPNSPERPWVGRHPHVEIPLTPDALIEEMDRAGVARAILVPPSWDNDRNDLVLDASRRYPGRFAAMGRIDTEAPGSPALIADWARQPGML